MILPDAPWRPFQIVEREAMPLQLARQVLSLPEAWHLLNTSQQRNKLIAADLSGIELGHGRLAGEHTASRKDQQCGSCNNP
ncbi:MAG: hypothetical protein IKJ89_08755 [Kiritimatiellae bacterium]|nr:hypothetical protein [Kiritimatiellia bacterium]